MPRFLARSLAALAVLSALLVAAGCGPLFDPDTLQDRAAVPAERLSRRSVVEQELVPRRNGLAAVDVLIAVYPEGVGDEDGELVFSLRAAENGSTEIARSIVPVRDLRSNQRYRLWLPPQRDSAGRRYLLRVESTTAGPARATVWTSGDDAYPDGVRRLDGREVAGDLAFRAYYDYAPAELAADLVAAARAHGWPLLVAVAALLLPGRAIQRWLLPDEGLDLAERAGLWLGLGVAATALLWLLVTSFGLRLGTASAAAFLGASAVAGLLPVHPAGKGTRGLAPSAGPRPKPHPEASGAAGWASGGAALATVGAFALRYVHAKDLALPMWGDSVHHTLISRLMAELGQVPADYGPLVPPQPFNYHFGFHAQVVLVHWLTGLDVARAVLLVGQAISALLVLPTYLMASRLTGDRRAGLVAGALVGLVSLMPAYSVTWGRYPQLTGLLVLPAAVYALERVLRADRWRSADALVAAIASAGLLLAHPRVVLLYGCFVLARLIVGLASRSSPLALPGRSLPRAAAVAIAAVAIAAPWLLRLASSRSPEFMLAPAAAPAFTFPIGILTYGLDRYLLAAAIAGVAVSLLLRRWEGAIVALWVGLSLGAANSRLLGLPVWLFLSNDALAIALFLPIAVLVGVLAASLLRIARHDRWPRLARLAPALLLVGFSLWGAERLVGVVNPACLLATAADVEALRWVEANTDPDAAFLVNSYRWQGDIYMGSDGGYWLPALANRRASTPPLPYSHGSPTDVARINELAASTQPDRLDLAALRPILISEGLTHVFVGSRGGSIAADALLRTPGYRLLFTNGRAWVFEVLDAES